MKKSRQYNCPPKKALILITATYERPGRVEYIKRCIETFGKLENTLWILVEDADATSAEVKRLVGASGISHVYLSIGPTGDSGHTQKNHALEYIKDRKLEGIAYVADDDNWYDVKLFDEIRKTKKVSVFPVGNLGPSGIENPVVKNGKVVGWKTGWPGRKFELDFAAFAFNTAVLQSIGNPILKGYGKVEKKFKSEGELMSFLRPRMEWETEFLEKFVNSKDEFELLCDNCTKCYVWHNQPLGTSPNVHYTRLKFMLISPATKCLKSLIKKILPDYILNFIRKLRVPK